MPPTTVYLLTDARMALHNALPPPLQTTEETCDDGGKDDIDDEEDPPYERPERIAAIYNKLLDLEDNLLRKIYPWSCGTATDLDVEEDNGEGTRNFRCFLKLPCIPANRETIELAHSSEHYERMRRTMFMSDEELRRMNIPNDLYFNRHTFFAATLAAGGVVECVNAVTDGTTETTRAIALIRPPGHHAGRDEAMGFCYFNNIAVAAKHAIHAKRAERVFILDWDIHHGNGIQDLTYDDSNIFYLSIHRYSGGEKGWFYPGTGNSNDVGEGEGKGTNLNIAWNRGGMGNAEYAEAFHSVVLPVVSSFQPDLIIIACGLDAAKGDLLGDCGVSPDLYYAMTDGILKAAGSRTPLVVALEGGYNLDVIAKCMEAVALSLLDEPWKDDNTDYEKQTYWTSKSILPLRTADVLKKSNPYSLERYLDRGCDGADPDSEKPPNATARKGALACIKRSTKAMLRNSAPRSNTDDWLDKLKYTSSQTCSPPKGPVASTYKRQKFAC